MKLPPLTTRPAFLDEDFLLENDYARELYHGYAADMPIIDYHCHLPPQAIAENQQYENLTQIWLYGDHYKWRAMRANGVAERYITGDASDAEKFAHWAATVPYTLRNPLYHWSHLELKRYFGLEERLTPQSAPAIYEHCSALLGTPGYRVRPLLERMKVAVICTTDDPVDDLRSHQQLREAGLALKVLPAFRPDQALCIGQAGFAPYLQRLGATADVDIRDYRSLLSALQQRVDYFHAQGARLSDHGLTRLCYAEATQAELARIFQKGLQGQPLPPLQVEQYQSAVLIELGRMYHAKGWAQQFHLGALRNNSSRMMQQLGPDTGFDSIGDFSQATAMAKYFDALDRSDQLAKTIVYNLNPADNEVFATMIGNFNDGSIAGKMQYGSAWWFLDQLDGMERQINALSNMGLLSRFIGMLTDSRSFLSYPRHEYFRRLLCNLFGRDIARGHLPDDLEWIGHIIQDICYRNAKRYFDF
jgi:glucuronate isomerase